MLCNRSAWWGVENQYSQRVCPDSLGGVRVSKMGARVTKRSVADPFLFVIIIVSCLERRI